MKYYYSYYNYLNIRNYVIMENLHEINIHQQI